MHAILKLESKPLPKYWWTEFNYPNEIEPIFKGRNWVTRVTIASLHWHCGAPAYFQSLYPFTFPTVPAVSTWGLLLHCALFLVNLPFPHRCPHTSICSLDLYYEPPAHASNCLLAISPLALPTGMAESKFFSLDTPDPIPGFLSLGSGNNIYKIPPARIRELLLLPFLTHW